jgi:hypothetical protein
MIANILWVQSALNYFFFRVVPNILTITAFQRIYYQYLCYDFALHSVHEMCTFSFSEFTSRPVSLLANNKACVPYSMYAVTQYINIIILSHMLMCTILISSLPSLPEQFTKICFIGLLPGVKYYTSINLTFNLKLLKM